MKNSNCPLCIHSLVIFNAAAMEITLANRALKSFSFCAFQVSLCNQFFAHFFVSFSLLFLSIHFSHALLCLPIKFTERKNQMQTDSQNIVEFKLRKKSLYINFSNDFHTILFLFQMIQTVNFEHKNSHS